MKKWAEIEKEITMEYGNAGPCPTPKYVWCV